MVEKEGICVYTHVRRESFGMRERVAKQDHSSEGLFPFLKDT